MTKLLFGCGYLGARVAARWRSNGERVTIVTRDADRAHRFKQQGYNAIVADVTRSESLVGLPVADTVLFAVGLDRRSGQSVQEVFAGGVRNVLSLLPAGTGRFIYVSTTGVYGSANGGWVDEQTPPQPQRPAGEAALAAEELLRSQTVAGRSVILRLAGIYGPGRIPFLDKLRASQPIAAPSAGYLNLIHVEDAADAVLAAEANNVPLRQVYCVADGHPVKRGEFYCEVARRIGAAEPQFITPDANSPRVARAAADKRIRNARMLTELRVHLNFPSYREGLSAILGV